MRPVYRIPCRSNNSYPLNCHFGEPEKGGATADGSAITAASSLSVGEVVGSVAHALEVVEPVHVVCTARCCPTEGEEREVSSLTLSEMQVPLPYDIY